MSCPAVQIEEAVLQAIASAEIASLGAGSIFPRDQPQRLASDPNPACVVIVGNETEIGHTNQTIIYAYPVLVVISKKTALLVSKSDPWMKEVRYTIRETLYRPFLTGLAGIVRGCIYQSSPEFTPLGFDQGYRVTGQLFTYRIEELKPPTGE